MVASIEDVARLAGVSIATVSRALRGLPDVATATRDRVLAAAAELDYIASPFAARLASGRAATVGVVVPFVNRWFFAEVIDTVETALRKAGYDLLLYNLGDEAGRARFFDVMPMRKRVDAVPGGQPGAQRRRVRRAGLPRLTGRAARARAARLPVRAHRRRPGRRQAVEHLLGLGHRRIGLIGGDTDDPMRFTPPLHRRDGYRDALRDAGIEPDPAVEVLGYFTVDGGSAGMEALLALPDRPTAIFAESDEMAYGALRTIRRAHLRVPEDVAVIGFDDQANAELMDLSTVRQPVAEQAIDITTRLLAAIDGDIERTNVVLPTELIVRGSTRVDTLGLLSSAAR